MFVIYVLDPFQVPHLYSIFSVIQHIGCTGIRSHFLDSWYQAEVGDSSCARFDPSWRSLCKRRASVAYDGDAAWGCLVYVGVCPGQDGSQRA